MKRSLLSALLALAPVLAFAQAEWYEGKPIADIVFTGLEAVPAKDLEGIARPRIGQIFSLELFWELQAELYALDSFQSIEGRALPGDDRRASVIVQFRVTEKPAVAQVVLEGNRALRRSELLDAVRTRKGGLAGEARVEADAAAVRELYARRGYLEAVVRGAIEPAEGERGVRVVFRIDEGPRTVIRSVRFTGNRAIPAGALRRLMQTRASSSIRARVLEEERLEEDIGRIRARYGEQGYPDARVVRVERRVEPDPGSGRKALDLVLHLEEGRRWRYGGMRFAGNRIFSDRVLQELVRQRTGSVLNVSRLEADFRRVREHYEAGGYIFNLITLDEERDGKAGSIRYVVRIEEEERAHIGGIRIRGNRHTREEVIRRELTFQTGEVFSTTRIMEGLRNLHALGYFAAIEVETPPGDAEGLVDLVIAVEEKRPDTLNLGLRASEGDFPIGGTVSWLNRNFLGRGQLLGAGLEVSDLRQSLFAHFTEPRISGTRWLGGGGFSVEHAVLPGVPAEGGPADSPADPLMEVDSWRTSAGLNAGYHTDTPLGRLGLRAALGTQLEYLSWDDALQRPLDPALQAGLRDWTLANRLSAGLYWDNRDLARSPSRGWYLEQGVTYAGGLLLGDRHYIRTDTIAEGYLPLLTVPVSETADFKLILAGRSSLSLIFPQLGRLEESISVSDLLVLDGVSPPRGWPLERGKKAVWQNSLELRVPIDERFLWSSLFVDAAAAWDRPGDIAATRLEDYRFSVGAGLQLTSPQFPVQLYVTKSFRVAAGRVEWLGGRGPLAGLGLNLVFSFEVR